MFKSILFSLIIAFLIVLNLSGEEVNLNYQHLSTRQGLPQASVTAVLQDSLGFIWFGTADGLSRFDSSNFFHFTSDPADPGTLGGNYIHSLCLDKEGMIWIGTKEGGLSRFDPVKQSFTRFRHHPLQPASLSQNQVRCLAAGPDDSIWVGTPGGLDRYNRETGLFDHYRHDPDDPGSLSHDDIRALTFDGAGNLWIATWGGGLNVVQKGSHTIAPYPLKGHFTMPLDRIKALAPDGSGNIYLGTPGGFARLDTKTGIVKYFNGKDVVGKLKDHEINALYYDSSGYLWIGTHVGLHYFNISTQKISGYLSVANMPYKLGKNLVNCIYKDRMGNIWTGIWGGGVYYANPEFSYFKSYRKDADMPNTFSDNDITAICRDWTGILWVGSMHGLNRFDRANFKITPFLHDPRRSTSLSANEVSSIFEDRSGVLWVGTHGGGLNRLGRSRSGFLHYRHRPGVPSSLGDDNVTSIMEDLEGRLWVGTKNAGISVFDKYRWKFSHYRHDPALPGTLSDNHILSLYLDRDGTVWVGTHKGGLNHFDPKTGKFKSYLPNPRLPRSLSHRRVQCITRSSNGALWVGTGGGGLNVIETPGAGFRSFTVKNGLPSNVIQGIIEGEEGKLWISTDKGLARFDPDSFRTKNFDWTMGLQSNEFNAGSFYKTDEGELFFGGLNGFNSFFPSDIRALPFVPPVVLTGFYINSRPVAIGATQDDREILEKSITVANRIRLNHQKNALAFRFSALNYTHSQSNRYAYKLEGFEKDWNYVNRWNFALYINLPAGEYTFRVKSSLDGVNWHKKERNIKLIIFPPFWQTLGFKILLILMVMGSALFIHRFRVRSIEMKREKLKKMVEQRTRELETANQYKSQFLARMSHEIRTPMNSVIGFTDMLLDTDLNEEQLGYARTIHHSGEMLLVLINDILDLSRIEAGQLAFDMVDFDPEILAFHVVESMAPRIGNKSVELYCKIGDRVPAFVKTDAGRFRQVLINLTGNAVKFTHEGEVELSLDVEAEEEHRIKLHAIVRDTGIGIPKEQLDSVFEVFQQGDGSITRKYGGTGLGLAICKQIARLMKGDVWAESEPDKGSVFHFTSWVEKSEKKAESKVFPPHLTGKRILVVDDNPNNLEILSHQLTRIGMRVTRLNEGKGVVSVLQKSFNDKDPFDLCILDIKLPGMNGYRILEEIRKQNDYIANLPVLALSSSTTCRSKKFKDAGFDGFLPRPIHRQKLLDMTVRLLGEREINGKRKAIETFLTRHTLAEEAKHSIRILLAEDNPVNQKLTRFMLTKAGYQLDVVNNGEEAVAAVTADPGGYDMILMDVQMPIMDGREATRLIREKGFTHIPIVAITADVMKGDREKLLKAGMDDYISKPIKREVVFEKVKKWALDRKN